MPLADVLESIARVLSQRRSGSQLRSDPSNDL